MGSKQDKASHIKSQSLSPRKWLKRTGLSVIALLGMAYWPAAVDIAFPPASAASGAQLQKQMAKGAQLPKGYHISLYAQGLKSARLIIATSMNDLIVSSRLSKLYLVSPNQNDKQPTGKVRTLMSGLNQPHGLLLHKGWLYIAEEHRVIRIRFDAQKKAVRGKIEIILTGMPDNGGHSTRTLKKGPDGWFYLSIGSSCNACREQHPWRATILRFHPDGQRSHPDGKTRPEIYATGLRNTVGFDWQPGTNRLYGVENGRDWLGDNFPPDELNLIQKGGFYGWPFRHGNNIKDPELGNSFKGSALSSAFNFKAHVAPLSIRFLKHQKAPNMQNTALVAQHGSWNRSSKIGYRLVSLHFGKDGTISRKMFLTGFLQGKKVIGRPVDIFEQSNGDLFISDDLTGVLWLVRYRG